MRRVASVAPFVGSRLLEAYIKQLRMMELQRRIKERSRASRREEAASKTLPTKVSAPSQKNACAGAGVRVTRLGACA